MRGKQEIGIMAEKHITIGIAGHVDHGKTALVQCLTGIDTDRLKEEKQRGVSIEPGIALLTLPSGNQLALVDVPGHSDYLKNTIRGLSSVDMAILVVAADDGVMPQTLDHLEVLKFLRAESGFIVLSKTDLVDGETVELAELEIREVVKGTFLEGKPVLPFSAVHKQGVSEILRALEGESLPIHGKSIKAPFRFWVDQVRNFPGFGTVVSGTILTGIIRQDDLLHLQPSQKETKARFLEVHHQKVAQAVAGQRVGINLHKIPLQEVHLGMTLAAPGLLNPSKFFNAEVTLLGSRAKPLLDRQRIKLCLGTGQFNARVVMMNGKRLGPGETGLIQFRLEQPLAVLPRDPFVICPMNYNTVIGGGMVLEATREKFRSVKAENSLAYLHPLHQNDVQTVTNLFFEKFPNRPVTVDEIAGQTGFPSGGIFKVIQLKKKLGELIELENRGFFLKVRYEELKRQLPEIARRILGGNAFKLSVAAEELRCRLEPSLDNVVFERMLKGLVLEGQLIQTEGLYCLPNFKGKLSEEKEKLTERLLAHARDLGYESFSAGYFCKLYQEGFDQREIQKLLDLLHAQKKLIRLNDNRFLVPEALEKIKKKVQEVISVQGRFTIGDIKGVFGYGRTRGIPVLEHLDTIGFTRRIGDERVLVEKNRDSNGKQISNI